jgi:phage pi2 protein 07
MQTITAQVAIEIPQTHIMITQVEYAELQKSQLSGTWWSMKDLEERTGRKVDWLKENILYVQRYKNLLDAKNGGPVYYPAAKGQPWAFQAARMAKFLDDNFARIMSAI